MAAATRLRMLNNSNAAMQFSLFCCSLFEIEIELKTFNSFHFNSSQNKQTTAAAWNGRNQQFGIKQSLNSEIVLISEYYNSTRV